MADTQTCNDMRPHGPHTWSSPSETGGKGQELHNCPGVSES